MVIEAVLVGALTVTAYQPTPAQTRPECKDRYACDTADGDRPTRAGCAVSQDLFVSGKVKFGDVLYIDGIGYRTVNDKMNARIKNSVDVLVFTKTEERRIGVKRREVYKLGERHE